MKELDPELYTKLVPGLTMPQYLNGGVDPTALHYGMFQTAMQKLGS